MLGSSLFLTLLRLGPNPPPDRIDYIVSTGSDSYYRVTDTSYPLRGKRRVRDEGVRHKSR